MKKYFLTCLYRIKGRLVWNFWGPCPSRPVGWIYWPRPVQSTRTQVHFDVADMHVATLLVPTISYTTMRTFTRNILFLTKRLQTMDFYDFIIIFSVMFTNPYFVLLVWFTVYRKQLTVTGMRADGFARYTRWFNQPLPTKMTECTCLVMFIVVVSTFPDFAFIFPFYHMDFPSLDFPFWLLS